MSNFWGWFFHVFGFFENAIASALKSCIINLKRKLFILIFFWNKTGFLGLRRFSNLDVLHKGLLLQDWVFRLGINPTISEWNSQFQVTVHSCGGFCGDNQSIPFFKEPIWTKGQWQISFKVLVQWLQKIIPHHLHRLAPLYRLVF